MKYIQALWESILFFISDDEDPNEPIYDPVHLGAMFVSVIFTIGALFWLLWTLLVFEGGFFSKVVPAFQVLFTSKTLRDFRWLGYPYEMGIFEGFIANSIAFVLTAALVVGVWYVLETPIKNKDKEPPHGI